MAQLQVQSTTARTSRMITLNHPNSFDALCFRRVFTTPSGENELGGLDVLGGEDTPDIDYQQLGMAKVLFVDPWQASRIISEQIYANDGRVKSLALIESDLDDFELEKQDIFYLMFDDDVGLCYEVIGIEIPIGLPNPSSAKRYILNKRDDLDYYPKDDE